MKKSILMIAALATMVACSKDETVETVAKVPIAFGTSHVDNSTRAAIDGSYKGTNLVQSFKVYGTVTGNVASAQAVNIFDGDVVSTPAPSATNYASTTAWSCNEIQYWIPSSSYNFTAIVDGDVKDGSTPLNYITVEADPISKMPESITYDAATQKDLLLATAIATTDVNGVPNTGTYIVDESGSTGNKLVSFTFNHLLAKAKFTVKNTMSSTLTNEYSYKVTGIKITNAQKTGVYTIDGGTWAPTATPSNYTSDASLLFGNATSEVTPTDSAVATAISEQGSAESNYERLMIPADYSAAGKELSVTFTYELSVSNTPVYTKTVTKTAAVELVKGHAYNFVIELPAPGKEIKFTVQDVTDWETNHDNNNSTNDDITLS